MILEVKQSWSGLAAGGDDKRRTASAVFTVLFDQADPAAARPLLAAVANVPDARVPQIGESHPHDPWLRAGRPQVRPLSPVLFEVSVDYRGPAGETPGQGDNPLTAPPKRRWVWAASQEPIDMDEDGQPIVNSAGQNFDQNPMVEVYDPELVIERNEATDDPRVRLQYRMAVNADPFYGARPGQALMLPIEAEEVRQGDFAYWAKTYRIRFRRGPPDVAKMVSAAAAHGTTAGAMSARLAWYMRMLDNGVCKKVTRDVDGQQVTRLEAILDRHGVPVVKPVLLDGAGQVLPESEKPVWLYFRTSPVLPFRPFRLEG